METQRLISIEQEAFVSEIEDDYKEAGIEIFNKYGDVNNMETLSLGDVTKWNAIKAVDRGTVYTKLALNRDKNTFEKALRDIMKAKSKHN